MQDRIDLDNEAGHDDHRSQGDTQETKPVLSLVERHDRKTSDQGDNPDDHPLLVLLAKSKFIHIIQSFNIVLPETSADTSGLKSTYLWWRSPSLSTASTPVA